MTIPTKYFGLWTSHKSIESNSGVVRLNNSNWRNFAIIVTRIIFFYEYSGFYRAIAKTTTKVFGDSPQQHAELAQSIYTPQNTWICQQVTNGALRNQELSDIIPEIASNMLCNLLAANFVEWLSPTFVQTVIEFILPEVQCQNSSDPSKLEKR